MNTGLDTGKKAPHQTDGTVLDQESTVWLETPVLRFVDVAQGQSKIEPIVFRSMGAAPAELAVTIPPLAPFSLVVSPRSPFSSSFGPFSPIDGFEADSDGETRTELWIRYDATSVMATDVGAVTVRDNVSGREWRIELDGTGTLAHPI